MCLVESLQEERELSEILEDRHRDLAPQTDQPQSGGVLSHASKSTGLVLIYGGTVVLCMCPTDINKII